MADTKRSLESFVNASTGLFKDNSTGAISPQDLRDFTVSAYGGLFLTDETADANVTGVVGSLHVIEMNSGTPFTANRDFVLPTSAATGDRIGVAIKDGDATYEVLLKSGASLDLINGVDHSTTEWSRLFIAGEIVVFICVDGATADWLVERDGRIPCEAQIRLSADSPNLSATTFTEWSAIDGNGSTEDWDIGDILNATDGRITTRRAGRYQFFGYHHTTGSTASPSMRIDKDPDGTPISIAYWFESESVAVAWREGRNWTADCAVGDVLAIHYYHETASIALNGDTGADIGYSTKWGVTEILGA